LNLAADGGAGGLRLACSYQLSPVWAGQIVFRWMHAARIESDWVAYRANKKTAAAFATAALEFFSF